MSDPAGFDPPGWLSALFAALAGGGIGRLFSAFRANRSQRWTEETALREALQDQHDRLRREAENARLEADLAREEILELRRKLDASLIEKDRLLAKLNPK